MEAQKGKFEYSWEEAVEILRQSPEHQELIFNAYLTEDIAGNCERFFASAEFCAAKTLLKEFASGIRLLDMPSGNGIASYSFAKSGFDVVAVDPNPSETVGRGALAKALAGSGLHAEIVDAYGESLPFASESFDVVYVRQGLHHAANLPNMLKEIARVMRQGGVLLACREPVVDDYENSLQIFLDSQPDHQLYGGENAFKLQDYRNAITSAGLVLCMEMDPYDTVINMAPSSPEVMRARILGSRPAKVLKCFLPEGIVVKLGIWWAKRHRSPGRLYSFLAIKPAA